MYISGVFYIVILILCSSKNQSRSDLSWILTVLAVQFLEHM